MRSGAMSLALALAWFPAVVAAAEPPVTIRADFPGGNVLVKKVDGDTIQLAPDLRGGQPWFYWHFKAEARRPGRVTFAFARPPMIGVRGPAVSLDDGKSWHWLGADQVQYAPAAGPDAPAERQDRFSFAFTEAGQKVRFAVAIPYLQHDLDEFLAANAANRHLTRSVLTRTRLGRRPVELLQVGQPGDGRQAVLLTARHHACESMASFVLEGFVQEALSASPAGVEFRKKYVLYAVPFVDKDGVQQGDQGKNRLPHDHNRDYGKDAIYPEVQAIQDLGERRQVRFALDLHCPFLRGDIHEAFHFLGLGLPHIKDNVNEWTAWINEERPPAAMTPLNFLVDPQKPNAANPRINSHYFALREQSVLAVTLEVPYTQANCPLDAALARQYGVSLLRAWVRTAFLTAKPGDKRGNAAHASLLSFRQAFHKLYRNKPAEAEQLAQPYLTTDTAPAVSRAEAHSLMALLRLHQRKYPEALRHSETVLNDRNATTSQQATAVVQRLQAVCSEPQATADAVEACLAHALQFPYPSVEQQARMYQLVGDFYQGKQDYAKALGYARKQVAVALSRDQGRLLNRVAALHDLLKQPGEAVAARKEAVKLLRAQLGPTPARSIFAAQMTGDLFEALNGIPTTTLEEKKAAAALVLDHPVAPTALKEKVRKALADLEPK